MKYSPAEIAEQAIDLFLERLLDMDDSVPYNQYIDRAKAQAINEIIEGCNVVLPGEESKGPGEEYRKYFE